jgi:hypothetical protein
MLLLNKFLFASGVNFSSNFTKHSYWFDAEMLVSLAFWLLGFDPCSFFGI